VRQAATYATAVARWMAAGRPERSQAEVDRIYHTLCVRCEHITETGDQCRKCGCRLSTDRPALLNKIKMATEHCPLDKW